MTKHPVNKGPFIETGRQLKYQNPWLKVEESQIIHPNGNSGIYGTVTLRPGCTVLAMDSDDNVFLTREYAYAYDKETVELVSGGLNSAEDPVAGGLRELAEETGYTASDVTYLGVIDPFTRTVHSPNHMIWVRGLTKLESPPPHDDILEIFRAPFDDVLKMVMDGAITHAASVVAVLQVARRLGR